MQKIRFTFKFFPVVSGLILLCVCSNLTVRAQGDLMVFPKRIVFEGAVKSNELNLANVGKDTARYNISFVQYRMNEDGTFTEINVPDEGQNFADKFLRYYPRSVVLAPSETQVIKVQLTKTDQLLPGEYRSHIYFRAIPIVKPLGSEDQQKDTTKVSIKLVPIFGITIPAIIHIGPSTMQVTLSELEFSTQNDTIPTLNFKFNRTGNMSVYGDLSVIYYSPGGKKTEVAKAGGIAVYTPNKARYFKIALSRKSDVDYKSGTLHIEYSSPNEAKAAKYAEADLKLK